jgi:hypothetical protein
MTMKTFRIALLALIAAVPLASASADDAMKSGHRAVAPHADRAMRADASKVDAGDSDLDATMADWHKNFGF